ncbi:MAG: Gfo/Idh/MocA family oxidoreductase [Bacteroides sp.]|nr:Gfo/Idh/MocA family oxidoreductase [Bacteroides sp.]
MKLFSKSIFILIIMCYSLLAPETLSAEEPLRLGVAGVSHDHIYEVVQRIGRGDFILVGVAEKNDTLRKNNPLTGLVDNSLFFADLAEMIDQTRPEAVIVYESIYDHLKVVEICAPRGVHVMVEKPLAVNNEQARQMAQLAAEHQIHLLTNYETTWYPSLDLLHRSSADLVGEITRIQVFDGHQGPIELGCRKEFLEWLTDPVLNGGGAVMDFGCYGANLATWLFQGERPLSISALLKQQKPGLYPRVDDDATILLEYPTATVQILASWNWPMNRKDMYIYGTTGYIYQHTATEMEIYSSASQEKATVVAESLSSPYDNPFHYLKAVVRNQIEPQPYDRSSLENNLLVVEILQAAIESARTGQRIYLNP